MARNNEIDASAQQIGQDRAADFSTTSQRVRRDDRIVEPVDGPVGQEFFDELKFMEEPVEVMVHESAADNVSPIVEVFHNGVPQRFLRGQVQTVKRKFVEVLARAKKTGYSQQVYADRLSGEAVQRMIPHTALQYPFNIVSDKNPLGSAWLRKILAEA